MTENFLGHYNDKVKMSTSWLIIFFPIVVIWLLFLTFLFVWQSRFLRHFFKNTENLDLPTLLEKIFKKEKLSEDKIKFIQKEIEFIKEKNLENLQKVALVKFNPFKDIGGNYSFSLSLLDGKNNGVVITVLHARERTRVYAKSIKKGKSNVELSEEEKKALKDAGL